MRQTRATGILGLLVLLLALVASGCATATAERAPAPAVEEKNVQRPSLQGTPLASQGELDPRWASAKVKPLRRN